MVFLSVYILLLISSLLYSFALVDPNFTLVNNSWWAGFREIAVQFGYYQRANSWLVYASIVVLLFLAHFYLISRKNTIRPLHVALLIGGTLLMSYPFLSHDFFNYLFDAKIVTFYGKNPYLFRALDFPSDQWVRFMHWTHRTYPYGPAFLLLTLIPSFFSFGKLILAYLFFKLLFIGLYISAVWALEKENRVSAVFFATHPLIIVEGLINSHNDIVGVSIALIGIYLLYRKRTILSRILLILSLGIKYFTFPYIFVTHRKSVFVWVALILQIGLLVYLRMYQVLQPWYFLNLFVLVVWFRESLSKWFIFFSGLLFSYYPYIRLGDWGSAERVIMKENIITIFFIANVIYVLLEKILRNFLKRGALSVVAHTEKQT